MQTPPTLAGRASAWRLASARLVSLAGSSAAAVALSWHLWEMTRSSAWVAAAFLAGSLVLGLASAPAGALADRVDRRRLMITSDVVATALTALLAVAVLAGAAPVVLVALLAAATLAESPFLAASLAALPNLVEDEDLPWVNALLGRIQTVATGIAPVTGGALAGLAGAWTVIALNAASFALSAVLVARIRARFSLGGEDEHDAGTVAAGVGARLEDEAHGRLRAARLAWRHALLRATIFPGAVAFVGVGFAIVANPQLADSYGLGAFGLGLLMGAMMGGAFLASFVVARLLVPGREFVVVVAGLALHGVGMAVVALATPLAAALAGMAVLGVGIGITAPARQVILQRHAGDRIRASLFGLMESIGWIAFAVSGVAAGLAVDAVGLRWSYGIAALLFGAGAALAIALRIERE